MTADAQSSPSAPPVLSDRERRVAAALRDNLRKRKQQQTQRAAALESNEDAPCR